ncbi:hypothetical protein EX30DRAFT_366516 [Ascodesmis nigricans]|uniref:Uncharacterized protein n=1 Tax=Ascodesmis nigricans TaxID=341454 RepID=A0A4V3SHU9_9PEZI|nr:hypothetical protein EX30DRAFT_366516 [Ascodesmis nigricans]
MLTSPTTVLTAILAASASISASPIHHHRREITRQQLDTDELTGMIASCIGHNEDPTPYLAEKHLLESPSCPPEIEIVYVDEGGTPDPDAGGRGGGAGESGVYSDEVPFPETGYVRRIVRRGGGWFGGLFGGSGSGSSGHDHGNSGGGGGSNGGNSGSNGGGSSGGSKTPSSNDDDEPLSLERLSAEWDSSGSGKGSNGGNGRGWGMGDGADDGEGEFRPMGQGWRGGNSGCHGHGSSGGHGKGGSGGGKGGSGGSDWLDFDC